jgi:hypothetical protein
MVSKSTRQCLVAAVQIHVISTRNANAARNETRRWDRHSCVSREWRRFARVGATVPRFSFPAESHFWRPPRQGRRSAGATARCATASTDRAPRPGRGAASGRPGAPASCCRRFPSGFPMAPRTRAQWCLGQPIRRRRAGAHSPSRRGESRLPQLKVMITAGTPAGWSCQNGCQPSPAEPVRRSAR